jgi:hypothetical protein
VFQLVDGSPGIVNNTVHGEHRSRRDVEADIAAVMLARFLIGPAATVVGLWVSSHAAAGCCPPPRGR